MEACSPLGTGGDFGRAPCLEGTESDSRAKFLHENVDLVSITQPSCCWAELVASLKALDSRCLGAYCVPMSPVCTLSVQG